MNVTKCILTITTFEGNSFAGTTNITVTHFLLFFLHLYYCITRLNTELSCNGHPSIHPSIYHVYFSPSIQVSYCLAISASSLPLSIDTFNYSRNVSEKTFLLNYIVYPLSNQRREVVGNDIERTYPDFATFKCFSWHV